MLKDSEIKFIVLLKSFAELGYTIQFIRDSRLITVNHRIPIGCNTFLWASRASSRDVTTIKKVIKTFSLA